MCELSVCQLNVLQLSVCQLGWNRFVGVPCNVVGADYVSQRMKYKLEMRNEEIETNITFNLVI